MFFLFCSKYDQEAIDLYWRIVQCEAIEANVLYVEDLYAASEWELMINDHASFAKVKLPNGKLISTENVTIFLNRVHSIHHSYWKKLDETEQNYFYQEWNAFLTGWLKAFEQMLINRPYPNMLTGYNCLSLTWSILAAKAGFRVKPQHYCSKDFHTLSEQNDVDHSILVFNNKVFGHKGSMHLAEACINLAKSVSCNLLEIFIEKKENGKYHFISATSSPSFSKYSEKFIELFKLFIIRKTEKQPALV